MGDTLPRRAMLALAATALVPAATGQAAPAPATPTPTEAEMLAVQDKMVAAIQGASADVLAGMFSEKLTYLHASGGSNDKAKQLAMLGGQPVPRYIKMETRDTKVRTYPGVGVLTGDILFTSHPQPGQTAAPKANPYRLTTVFANESGVWRLVNWQITAVLAQPRPIPTAG